MSTLAGWDKLYSSELTVVTTSLSHFTYEIKDESNSYGLIGGRDKVIRTLNNNWNFVKDKSWNGEMNKILIKNSMNNVVGFLTFDPRSKNVILEMENGFTAEMERKTFLFTSIYTWKNNDGDLITLKESAWNGKKPLKILLHKLHGAPSIEYELMLLYGVAYSIDIRNHYANLPLGFY